MRYLQNFLFRRAPSNEASSVRAMVSMYAELKPGTKVRVRSQEEIAVTLNEWNQLKRCAFMEEMWPYCGTTQTVFKRVGQFLDERDYLIKKCRGTVILDGVYCEGTRDFGPCDRSCFFFWREEWLEPIADSAESGIESTQGGDED